MKDHSMTLKANFSQSMLAGTLAGILLLTSGLAFAQSTAQETLDHFYYDRAVREMDKGHSTIGKVVNDLNADKNYEARFHFNRALTHFDNALVSFGKTDLPAGQKAAVDSLAKGLDALRKAVKDLERNNMDTAQKNCDEAQGYFAQASILVP